MSLSSAKSTNMLQPGTQPGAPSSAASAASACSGSAKVTKQKPGSQLHCSVGVTTESISPCAPKVLRIQSSTPRTWLPSSMSIRRR